MLGQARPNSITQVMIYNLGYDLSLVMQVCIDRKKCARETTG